MRDKNYRRSQEAKHFKKRLNLYSLYGDWNPLTYKDENGRVDFKSNDKFKVHYYKVGVSRTCQHKPVKTNLSVQNPEDVKNETWAHKLKNGDLKFGLWDKDNKKFCNRTRRRFEKLTDANLPRNRFLERRDVIWNRDIV